MLPHVGLAQDEPLFAFRDAPMRAAEGAVATGAVLVAGPVVQAGLFFAGLVGGVLTAWGITGHQQAQQDQADAVHDAFHDAVFGAIRGTEPPLFVPLVPHVAPAGDVFL